MLEIGFGGGEHLVAQAAANPGARYIGVEPFLNGVASCLRHIEERLLLPPDGGGGREAAGGGARNDGDDEASRGTVGNASGPHPLSHALRDSSPIEGEQVRSINIRLHHGDARDVIARLPQSSLDLVYILFPDPWPKTRHHKRRLIQPEVLDALARVMKPGAEVRFATDWANYAAWTLWHFTHDARFAWTAECAEDWRKPWPGHATTRYEAKRLGDCAPIWLRFRLVWGRSPVLQTSMGVRRAEQAIDRDGPLERVRHPRRFRRKRRCTAALAMVSSSQSFDAAHA